MRMKNLLLSFISLFVAFQVAQAEPTTEAAQPTAQPAAAVSPAAPATVPAIVPTAQTPTAPTTTPATAQPSTPATQPQAVLPTAAPPTEAAHVVAVPTNECGASLRVVVTTGQQNDYQPLPVIKRMKQVLQAKGYMLVQEPAAIPLEVILKFNAENGDDISEQIRSFTSGSQQAMGHVSLILIVDVSSKKLGSQVFVAQTGSVDMVEFFTKTGTDPMPADTDPMVALANLLSKTALESFPTCTQLKAME